MHKKQGVGIHRFFLLDNGSQDDLNAHGYDVSIEAWPWPKTQGAGFSYPAAAHRDSSTFSPSWAKSRKPNNNSLVLTPAGDDSIIGQAMMMSVCR